MDYFQDSAKLLALLMFGAIILSSLFWTKEPIYFEYAVGHVNLMFTVLIIQSSYGLNFFFLKIFTQYHKGQLSMCIELPKQNNSAISN